ncbi:MAG: GHKL domain-containing protein [Clostridia bacterium]|nr:GHKL domain-containing protein [Clostridia bacterium]
MDLLSALKIIDYCLALIFGVLLSADISGAGDKKHRRWIVGLCAAFLLLQGMGYGLLGLEAAKKLYPLVVHLPLVLALIFIMKRPAGISIVSVCTAYLCCQLPRWLEYAVSALTHSPIIGEICYIIVVPPLYLLLRKYFAAAARDAMSYSGRFLLMFGSLPAAYYIFDYATTVYSDALYREIYALNQFLPTAIILFYVLFLTAYHVQSRRRSEAELQSSMLEAELNQSRLEMEVLRNGEIQAAIYQHDMRHHLMALEGLLSDGQPEKAEEYIKKVQADVEAITHRRFCENQLVNLLCSAFMDKAKGVGVQLRINAKLPAALSISDTELCAVISNGLENAIAAAAPMEEPLRYVEFFSEIRHNKLLIEIKNPYSQEVIMENGIPLSSRPNHGYGCRSIKAIAERYRGLCAFEAAGGIFTLRVVLPVHSAE